MDDAIDLVELNAFLRALLRDAFAQMGEAAFDAFVAGVLAAGDKDASSTWSLDEFVNFYRKCLASDELRLAYERKVLLRFSEATGELQLAEA